MREVVSRQLIPVKILRECRTISVPVIIIVFDPCLIAVVCFLRFLNPVKRIIFVSLDKRLCEPFGGDRLRNKIAGVCSSAGRKAFVVAIIQFPEIQIRNAVTESQFRNLKTVVKTRLFPKPISDLETFDSSVRSVLKRIGVSPFSRAEFALPYILESSALSSKSFLTFLPEGYSSSTSAPERL